MRQSKTPSFVLTLRLNTQKYQEDVLDKRFNIGRMIYNACLGEAYKNYKLMTESKEYRNARKLPKGKERNSEFKKIRERYQLSVSDIDAYVSKMQHKFKDNLDSHVCQKLAERALDAVNKLIVGKAKRVYFKNQSEDISLEGKTNTSGIKYRNGCIEWNDLKIPVVIKPNDDYVQLAIQSKVKYCRIYRRIVGNKYKYYVQLILEGTPTLKGRTIGEGDVGIDAGTKTAGIASDKEVKLVELSPETNGVDKEILRLQRRLDRSRRATNPENYNKNGTIKKGIKGKWKKSGHYIKTKLKIRDLYRKRAETRRQSHNMLANHIISLGNNIKVENMDYKALQKRAKETIVNRKTKKFNKKKRFGKSLQNKSPGMLLNIIDRKLSYFGKKLIRVDAAKVKASQYNHIDDTYTKKQLSDRWNTFIYNGNEIKVQRDLYSAYILQNTENDEIDKKKCIDKFDDFLKLHDMEIQSLIDLKKHQKLVSSMGI